MAARSPELRYIVSFPVLLGILMCVWELAEFMGDL